VIRVAASTQLETYEVTEKMDDENVEAAADALQWIGATLLQITRFVEGLLLLAEADRPDDATVVTADAHFLLNACAQAEKALHRAGYTIPPGRRTTIRSLRDVYEHWEQHKRTFESRSRPKSRAGQRFSEAHPDQLPWAFKFDATGTYISALRLEDLWEELVGIERTLALDVRARLRADNSIELPLLADTKPFPRRPSKCLGFAMVTQNIIIDFDNP
jgi:hypothetical protein